MPSSTDYSSANNILDDYLRITGLFVNNHWRILEMMITAAIIFGATYLTIAAGRIPSVVVALIGAAAMVLLGVITPEHALTHVDLEVIFLVAGMMVLAEILSETGAFDWLAIHCARFSRGNGFLLLITLALVTAVASALLDNVTTVVIMVPITLSLCRSLQLDPIPFLLGEVFASNIGGAATIVGDPPNIIIASAANIGFTNFINHMLPISLVSMAILFVLLFVWFRDAVKITAVSRETVSSLKTSGLIKDRLLLAKSLAIFTLTIVGFFLNGPLGISPAFIALSGAALLLLVSKLDPAPILRNIEWTTLAFLVGLFILVGGVSEAGLLVEFQKFILHISGGDDSTLAILLVFMGGGLSAVVDNIPFTATMVMVIDDIAQPSTTGAINPLWWALTMGADLGGNLTIVGASANIVVVTVARANGHKISFMRFLKYGSVIGVFTLASSVGYILLRYY